MGVFFGSSAAFDYLSRSNVVIYDGNKIATNQNRNPSRGIDSSGATRSTCETDSATVKLNKRRHK